MSVLVIKHDLSKLSPEDLAQYLRDVSVFIGLDPNLNALDTIWMQNENGPGQSLVVYARRGTAEILRNLYGIEISTLSHIITPQGAIVFTATGKNAKGRQEIAVGSKFIGTLSGKALDDAIMTASTRALRRVTMQFTSLGILDESEVGAVQGSTANPAAGATLAGSAVVLPPMPSVPANNAPGRDVTASEAEGKNGHSIRPKTFEPAGYGISDPPKLAPMTPLQEFSAQQQALRDDAKAHLVAKVTNNIVQTVQSDIISDIPAPAAPVTPAAAPVPPAPQAGIKSDTEVPPARPKRAYKKRNAVSLDGPEPEVVSNPAPASQAAPAPVPAPAVPVSVPTPVSASVETAPKTETVPQTGTSVPNQGTEFPGKPNEDQMNEYRKRVSVFTSELPSSQNMGSVQKMRAFITHMSGAAPQFMTIDQWQEMLSFFESFVERNKMKGLITYINDTLGVK